MGNFVPHIATLEIPVSNLQRSIHWYTDIFGVTIHFRGEKNAMLTFESKGVPTLFLVETTDLKGASFKNTTTDITHSIIDFYTPSLTDFHKWLKGLGVKVHGLNIDPIHGYGGFSFEDPDGNLLGATNTLHPGQ